MLCNKEVLAPCLLFSHTPNRGKSAERVAFFPHKIDMPYQALLPARCLWSAAFVDSGRHAKISARRVLTEIHFYAGNHGRKGAGEEITVKKNSYKQNDCGDCRAV